MEKPDELYVIVKAKFMGALGVEVNNFLNVSQNYVVHGPVIQNDSSQTRSAFYQVLIHKSICPLHQIERSLDSIDGTIAGIG